MNTRVIFMGTPEFAVPILETLIKMTDVVLVVSQPDAYVGRKKVLTASPVKQKAIEYNIPVFQPEKIKLDNEEIMNYNPDLIVTCAYGQILPESILKTPRLGCINVHASLLPKYRGGAPIHHALINGEEKTGITIMYMDTKMDNGDIITQEAIAINPDDTVATLHDKLSILGANLLARTLPSIIDQTNTRIKQDEAQVTFAPTIKRGDEHLSFNQEAKKVFNKVRGLNSWPLANIILDNEEIKIVEGYIGENTKEKPSQIVNIKKDALGISCLDKIFYVTKLKPAGKKIMTAKDYLNGINKNELMKKVIK